MKIKQACFSCVLLGVVLHLVAGPSFAVVIFLKDSNTPIMGFLVRQDERSIRIEQVLPDGSRRTRDFVRAEIDDVLLTVSHERLEKLDYDEPQAYRDYAEELTPKQQDPEARETAMRLYLIAAHLDPQSLGRSCMLGLINLARSVDEERKFRAMAYLLDPEHDQTVLRSPGPVQARPQEIDSEARLRLLNAVRQLRQDRKSSARQEARRPEVRALLEQFSSIVTWSEFNDACSEVRLAPSALKKLILLELTLQDSVGETEPLHVQEHSLSWLQSIRRDGLAPVPTLTLETLTEFDPRYCHFRGGKWVTPDQGDT